MAAAFLLFSVLAVAVLVQDALAAPFRHDLTVELQPASHSLSVQDHVIIDNPEARAHVFSVSERARIKSVLAGGSAARYTFRSGTLTVFPDQSTVKGGPLEIDISFDSVFDDPIPSDPASFDNPGFGVTGTVSEKGTFLLSDSGWYPQAGPSDTDRLTGGSQDWVENSFMIKINAPRGVYAVTAGELTGVRSEGDRSVTTWKVDAMRQGLSLSAARYSIRFEKTGTVPVYTFFFPESDSLSDTYLKAASSHIAFYEDLHGPYAFPKFAVVENFFPTGYGFPSYTLLGSTVLHLPFIPQTSLRHEVAHCWWGNGVLVDYDSGNWSEGLTTYVADYLSTELASAAEAQQYRLRILRDYATLAASGSDSPLLRFTARTDPATRAVGYGKAAFVFHMIRQKIGDEAFWRSLRRIYRERFQLKTSWDDFRKVFAAEGRSDDRDSMRFFDQWLARSGAPRLELKNVSAKKSAAGWEVAGDVLQKEPWFDLDVNLELTASGAEKVDSKVNMKGPSSPFIIRCTGAPEKLAVDPGANVFRLLYPEEIPATVNSLKSSKDLVAVLGGGVSEKTTGAFQMFLAGLNHAGAAMVPESKVDANEIGNKDVLLLGFPQSELLRGMLASAPRGVKISAERFSLDGSFSSDSADSLFVAFNDPQRGGKLTALFMSLPGAGADSTASAARKITHYGQYSYLAFSRGTNVAKGTWEITSSPLIFDFKKR